LGRCRGTPLVFLDTNILIDADEFVKHLFAKSSSSYTVFGVICDFIEGETLNLRKPAGILDGLKDSDRFGLYFETKYNSRDGSNKSLDDMPNGEMKEAVLVEYDKKLDPSGMLGISKEAKKASSSKSKFVDFSLLTVATISAYKRKRQSVIVSRDRWIKLSCKSLQEQFKVPIYCYDQWNYSTEEILNRARLEK
jgi:hypothetical protein